MNGVHGYTPYGKFYKCETKECINLISDIPVKNNKKRFCTNCLKQKRLDTQLARYYQKKEANKCNIKEQTSANIIEIRK